MNFKKLSGKYKLFWGLCPKCNSDAPELYGCSICNFYHGPFPPEQGTKSLWWARFENELKG